MKSIFAFNSCHIFIFLYYLIYKISKPITIFLWWNTRYIFAQKCTFKNIFQFFSYFIHSQDINDTENIELTRIWTKYSSFIRFKYIIWFIQHSILSLLLPYAFINLTNSHHQRIIINVIIFKKSTVNFDLISKYFLKVIGKMNLFSLVNPIFVLQFFALLATSTIERSF